MAQVTITINSREYAIACENGQEVRIMQLARVLEEKAELLKDISGQINENMLLAMIGILVADDLMEAKKKLASAENSVAEEDIKKTIKNADLLLAEKLKIVNEKIKSVAKKIETL